MIRVAVDAMGGDTAPQAEIAGVVQALTDLPDKFIIQLVGRPEVIGAELDKYGDAARSRIEIDNRVPAVLPAVLVDRTLTARALVNVVENALHAMPGPGSRSSGSRPGASS